MNLLQACIDVLFFHHPAAWWISRQLRDEREHCADDLAVKALEADRAGTRLSYARALLAAGLTAAALVAIVLSIATPRPAMADELPKDTNKIKRLTPEQARKLAEKFEQGYLRLNGLTTLDAATARALAESKVEGLQLPGLTTLDAETAKALANFKGDLLSLNGLTTLDADSAKALAQFKHVRLDLNRLTTLDAEAAAAVAAGENWDGELRKITALDSPDSVAIAKALATRKGLLILPNLKKISPKTLSALIAKEDVEIPLIETLELIQEPDGSATEDFVIPTDFETRQQQQRRQAQQRAE